MLLLLLSAYYTEDCGRQTAVHWLLHASLHVPHQSCMA